MAMLPWTISNKSKLHAMDESMPTGLHDTNVVAGSEGRGFPQGSLPALCCVSHDIKSAKTDLGDFTIPVEFLEFCVAVSKS